jgi:hypothetical protein
MDLFAAVSVAGPAKFRPSSIGHHLADFAKSR